MEAYDHIALIYNPKSTGDAPLLAKQTRRSLKDHDVPAALAPTKRAGHAVELAEHIVRSYKRPLIISVSGDGGYHEVINGVMNAKKTNKTSKPVVAVIGAGNANDHRRVTRGEKPMLELVLSHKPKPIDIIRLTVQDGKNKHVHYAHSYIGLGMTPAVAVELNKHELNRFRELTIVTGAFLRYKPFTIVHANKSKELDSLIFANINEMAKVLKLSDKNKVRDNRFEVVEFDHKGRLHLLSLLIRASLFGIKNPPSYKTYECSTIDAQPIQADGEILQLPANAHIKVESISGAIESLY